MTDDKPVRRYGVDDPGAEKREPPLVEEVHTLDLKPPAGVTYPDHLRDCYFRLEMIRRRAVSIRVFGVEWGCDNVPSRRREFVPKDATDLGYDMLEIIAKVKPENTT
jgi:hypothetical protein